MKLDPAAKMEALVCCLNVITLPSGKARHLTFYADANGIKWAKGHHITVSKDGTSVLLRGVHGEVIELSCKLVDMQVGKEPEP